MEGVQLTVVLTLNRNLDAFSGPVTVEYVTSDITAKGVDTIKFNECLNIAPSYRAPAGCGNYEQTRGYLTLPAGANSGGFKIRIMNDLCYQGFMKYLQVSRLASCYDPILIV